MNKAKLLVELSNIQRIADAGIEDILKYFGDDSYDSHSNLASISEELEKLKQKLEEELEE